MIAPPILQSFSKNLLSTPIYKNDSKRIKELLDFLKYFISKKKYKKFPRTIDRYRFELKILELKYEEIRKKEQANGQAKKVSRTQTPFYQFFDYKDSNREIYQRFKHRVNTSSAHRKNNDI
jgi:hypothetical protein